MRKRSEVPGRWEGRPGHLILAHDPGVTHHHAGLCPDRRHSQCGVCRVQRREFAGPDERLPVQAGGAFVTLKEGNEPLPTLEQMLKAHVAHKIGPLARPEEIIFTADLPKTRSGKIMRRLLRDVAEGRALGDTTTLADPTVVARLKELYEET